MRIIHRHAALEDLPRIVEIYNAAIPSRESTCDLESITVESRIEWFKKHDRSRRPIWVAVDEGTTGQTVIGYLSMSYFMNERPGYYVTSDMGLYIHPEHRRRGVGRFLLDKAIQLAPSLGIETLATTIFASNTPSIRLFEKAGFEHWGFMPGVARLGDIQRDLVMVGRRL